MNYSAPRLRHLSIVFDVLILVAFSPQLFGETPFSMGPGRAPSVQVITVGPDHNLWFTENNGLKIGRMTTSGVITEFSIAGAQGLTGITAGPDGTIWFTDEMAGFVGHVTTSGSGLVKYALPAGSHPQGICVGPDHNLWYVNNYEPLVRLRGNGFTIGKMTVSGRFTEYSTRVNAGAFQPFNVLPAQIVSGPDGNLWFVNTQAGTIGRFIVGKITTSGHVTIYPVHDNPNGITSGPDGNLWVIENNHVAKISTSGAETEFALQVDGGYGGITVGPDGNIWFNETLSVGYINPNNDQLTEFPQSNFYPQFFYQNDITSGPDGNLYIVGGITANIGQVSTAGNVLNAYQLNVGCWCSDDVLGPDGNIWTTEYLTPQVARVDPSGNVTTFTVPQNGLLTNLTAGPDGNVWYISNYNMISLISTSGNYVTTYTVTGGLFSLAAGPDGNVWFGEYGSNKIGKLTPGGTLTEYQIPTQSSTPLFITRGGDGNMWFSEDSTNKIGKINPSNGDITEYSPFTGASRVLGAILYGPDGNIWVMENTAYGAIAKITTAGVLLAEYPAQVEQNPEGLVTGPDGAIWFAQAYPNSVGRLTTSGVLTVVPLVTPNPIGNDLAVGSDHKLWVAEGAGGVMGRMSAIGGTGDHVTGTHGAQFNGGVASFVDGTPTAQNTDFTATIAWGDGTQGSATVSGSAGGPFTVSGTHTYSAPGLYTLTVKLHDNVDNSTYTASPGTARMN